MDKAILSKYHRRNPIREFDEKQTLYSLVFDINKDNMGGYCSSYLGDKTTFSELLQTTDALASALHAFGVKASEHVGVCLMTVPEASPTLLAISKLGAVSCWLDGSLKAADLLANIIRLNLRVLIIHELILPEFLQIMGKTNLEKIIVVEKNKLLPIQIPVDWKSIPSVYSFSDVISDALESPLPKAEYEDGKTTVIVQSSGSTGMPKLIEHTDYNFNAAIKRMAYCDIPVYLGKKSLITCVPWIIYGLLNSLYSSLVLGQEGVFTTMPLEEVMINHLGQFDFAYSVPAFIRALYNAMLSLKSNSPDEYEKMRREVSKLDFIISGGDKVPEEELISWQLMFDVPVLNGYGNNEVCGAAVVSPLFANRPGSIGISMYGNKLKAFDPDSGKELSDGEVGDLCIASISLFKGYFDNKEDAEKLCFVYEGEEWFKTGDLGYIDNDGFIYISGRSRRLIIDKLGFKISPDHGERLVQSCSGVRECAIIGAKRSEYDTVPVAYIEIDGSEDSESVIEEAQNACLSGLKDYERPKKYIIIDKIPHKVSGGKLDFLKLEEMASKLEWD